MSKRSAKATANVPAPAATTPEVVDLRSPEKEPDSSSQVKNWCGTLFPHNFDGTHRNSMDELMSKMEDLAGKTGFALIGCKEKTKPEELESLPDEHPDTVGKDHYHLVLCLETRLRFKKFLELWKPHLKHIHWEPVHKKSTPAKAVDYACKEGPPLWKFGNCPESKGKIIQDRWAETRRHAEEGNLHLVDDMHFVVHYKNLKLIEAAAASKRCKTSIDNLENYWVMGHTGAGKSLFAHEANGRNPTNTYVKCVTNLIWWDKYNFEPNVIVEDIDEKFQQPQMLKTWCDHYKIKGEIKGGMLELRPETFIFTSNVHPHAVYGSLDPGHIRAIDRRLRVLVFYQKNYKYPMPAPYLEYPLGVIPGMDEVAEILASDHIPSTLFGNNSNLAQMFKSNKPILKMFYPSAYEQVPATPNADDSPSEAEDDEEESDVVLLSTPDTPAPTPMRQPNFNDPGSSKLRLLAEETSNDYLTPDMRKLKMKKAKQAKYIPPSQRDLVDSEEE